MLVPGSFQPRARDTPELALVLTSCLHLWAFWAWDQALRMAGDGWTELSLGLCLPKELQGTKAAGRGMGKGARKGEKR